MQYDIVVPNEKYDVVRTVQFGWDESSIVKDATHIRLFWIIHYIISGSGVYKIDGEEFRIGPGDIFVMPPNIDIFYQADVAFNYMWICFTMGETPPVNLPYVMHCPEAMDIFIAMKKSANMEKGRGAFLNARLWDLFALIINSDDDRDKISCAAEYIESNYSKDISIDELAEMAGIERTYFSTLFKKKIGKSPKQYLTDCRMKIAASMLCNLNTSVSYTAKSVGYTDSFNFSKMFKKRFGVSPREYRNNRA